MRLQQLVPLFVALAACGEAGDDVCVPRHDSYHVTATLSLREPGKSAGGEDAGAATPLSGKLQVTVTPDRAIMACKDGLASELTPASYVLDTTLDMRDGSFSLDVPTTTYPMVHTPVLWLQVRLDENGNGRCDDGEPAAGAELQRSENVALQLELVRAACDLPTL
jgi:hypothetical protein